MTKHHPVIRRFRRYSGPRRAGFKTDFLGVRTRLEFGRYFKAGRDGLPAVDEDYFAWIDLLESVLVAEHRYTMMELGAGYGCWLVRAAAAVRQRGPIPFHLVAVEAEPQHFRWLKLHFRDNGLEPDEHTLIQAAVTDRATEVPFVIGMPEGGQDKPDEWYGQAISKLDEASEQQEWGTYEGFPVSRFADGWKVIRVPAVRLPDLTCNFQVIDLIHLDIQEEEWPVISSALDELNVKVRRLHIGTHTRDIEASLRRLLECNGWQCRADYACNSTAETPWGTVQFVDGVQSWANPRMCPGGKAEAESLGQSI